MLGDKPMGSPRMVRVEPNRRAVRTERADGVSELHHRVAQPCAALGVVSQGRVRARGASPGADVAGVSPVPVQMWQG